MELGGFLLIVLNHCTSSFLWWDLVGEDFSLGLLALHNVASGAPLSHMGTYSVCTWGDTVRQTYQIYSSISKGITAKIYRRLQHDYKYQNDFDYVHKRVFKVGESSAHFRNPHK